jgi:aminoglycoside 2''-phosphotransferase
MALRAESLVAIAAALAEAFPDLHPVAPLRPLGEGFRSRVVVTAGGVVFRIGKNGRAAAGYEREARLLPALAPRLPAAIPHPRWRAPPSAAFPFGALGYPMLPGVPLTPAALPAGAADLAADLAAFLRALHSITPDIAAPWGLPGARTAVPRWEAVRVATMPALAGALTRPEWRALDQWWDGFLRDEAGSCAPVALRHGDLWYENLLVDPAAARLSGVLDFEEVGFGDPAQDFATLLHLGPHFAGQVVAAYRAGGGDLGPDFARRLARRWQARELDGLYWAVLSADPGEFAAAVRKLRAGPILSPGEP